MTNPREFLHCFIASTINQQIEPYLEERHFCRGIVSFSIPDYGIMFRCRVDGDPINLEFAAFFSLLKFIKTQLSKEQIPGVLVHCSSPEFVFSFTPQSKHLAKGSEKERLLKEYARNLQIQVSFVEPSRNKALLSPADCPCFPVDRTAPISPDPSEMAKKIIKPFQRGIKL